MTRQGKKRSGAGLILVMLACALAGLYWLSRFDASTFGYFSKGSANHFVGTILGKLPKPTEPLITDPVVEPFQAEAPRKTVVKRIPPIRATAARPHAFWGRCDNCHLFIDGPAAGSRKKTPVGAALEGVSSIVKVGPPIRPDSARPHPAAGRCIKCHDIVIVTVKTVTAGVGP